MPEALKKEHWILWQAQAEACILIYSHRASAYDEAQVQLHRQGQRCTISLIFLNAFGPAGR